jgi:hypothetical protein
MYSQGEHCTQPKFVKQRKQYSRRLRKDTQAGYQLLMHSYAPLMSDKRATTSCGSSIPSRELMDYVLSLSCE